MAGAGASSIGTLYYKVEPSTEGFGKKIESQLAGSVSKGAASGAQSGGASLLSKIGSVFGRVGSIGVKAIAGVASAVGGVAVQGGISRALKIEQAQANLKGLKHDTADITEIMKNANAAVKGTAFGLDEAASVASLLSSAGVKSGAELEGVLTTIADTATISGDSMEDMGQIFAKIAAKGKIQGEEMLQLNAHNIPILDILAKKLGVSSEEVSKMVSKGQVDFKTFSEAMHDYMGGAAQASGETFKGALANVRAALGRFGQQLGASPALTSLTKIFGSVTPLIDKITAKFLEASDSISEVGENGQRTFTPLERIVNAVCSGIDKLTAAIDSGDVSLASLGKTFAGVAGGFGTLAAVGGGVLPKIAKNADSVSSAFGMAGGKVKGFVSEMLKAKPAEILEVDFSENFGSAGFKKIGEQAGAAADSIKGKFASVFGVEIPENSKKSVSGLSESAAAAQKAAAQINSNMKAVKDTGKASEEAKEKTSLLQKAFESLKSVGSGVSGAVGGISQAVSFFGAALKGLSIVGAVGGLVAGLGMLESTTNGMMSGMLNNLTAQLPGIFERAVEFINSQLPAFISSGAGLIEALLNAVITTLPELVTVLAEGLSALVQGVSGMLPTLIPLGIKLILTLAQSIIDNLPTLVSAGLSLFEGLVQGFTQALPVIIGMLPSLISSIIESLITILPALFASAGRIFEAVFSGLIQCVPVLLNLLPDLVAEIITALADLSVMFADAALSWVEGLSEGFDFGEFIGKLGEFLGQLWSKITEAAPKIGEAFKKIFTEAVPKLWEALTELLPKLWENLQPILGMAGDLLVQLLGKLAEFGGMALSWLVENAPKMAAAFASWFAEMLPKAVSGLLSLLTKIIEFAGQAIAWLVQSAPGMVAALGEWFIQMLPSLVSGLASLIAKLPGFVADVLMWIGGLAWQLAGAVGSWFIEMLAAFGRGVVDMLSAVWNFGGNIISTLADSLSGLWNGIKSCFDKLVNFFNISNWIEKGKSLVKGIADGITNAASMIWNAIKGIFGGMWGWISDKMGWGSGEASVSYSAEVEPVLQGMPSLFAPVVFAGLPSGATEAVVPAYADAQNVSKGRDSGVNASAGMVNQNFNIRVVRAEDDLSSAASVLYRQAVRSARNYGGLRVG